ncbi:sulfate transporter CysZ [Demequina sediminis]|uniref:Sulfate transporter CysZ n=1 Tax=Demequina sediminis TaxID=1930058 RepID=A0ABP9WEF0_9MICO|nr:EI24 domain-containing protein [Demequina sediminis]BDZ61045.1 hypothetical protein GCM10025873_08360 [Demequina sediminis]
MAARVLTETRAGITLAFSGARAWVRTPRLLVMGAVPSIVTAVIVGVLLGVLLINVGEIGRAIASGVGVDGGTLADVVAATAAIAVLAASTLVSVALFATVTLAIGQPFFEAISRRVDDSLGGLEHPAPEEPWHRALVRGAGESVVTVAISIGVSLGLLAVGLVPVVGSPTAFVLGALVGGRLLAIELTAYPLARRGIVSRHERIAALRPLRTRTVVFGACVFLTFLLPLGAVVAMPAAMVGATMLARQVTSPSASAGSGLPGLRLEGGTHGVDRGVDE